MTCDDDLCRKTTKQFQRSRARKFSPGLYIVGDNGRDIGFLSHDGITEMFTDWEWNALVDSVEWVDG